MGIERDHEAEREERIRNLVERLKKVQAEVARLTEEGNDRATRTIREDSGSHGLKRPAERG